MKKILCWLGWHKYSEWKISPLQALGNYHEWDYTRRCERCGKEDYKHE